MRWLLLFLGFNVLWIFSNGQNCELEGVTSNQWQYVYLNDPVLDTERMLFKEFLATNVIGVNIATSQYFSVSFDSLTDIVRVTPTAAFAEYESITPSSSATPQIGVDLLFTCTGGSRNLRFEQPITDVNNFEPTFSSSAYAYSLPMPFPQNIDVSSLGDIIQVTDNDIRNTRVSFRIEPEGDFTISYVGAIDTLNKVHRARIVASRSLRLTEPQTYVLHVTDEGNPTLSTTADLRITVDEDASVKQSPSFSEAFYVAEYNGEATNKVDISLPVQLHGSTDFSTLITGEHASLFQSTVVGGQVIVQLTENLPEVVLEEKTFIAVTIEVRIENAEYVGRTALIVSIPQPETTTTACPTEPTYTTTSCPETTTATECDCEICTTPAITPCPETTTVTECEICTTPVITPCPDITTTESVTCPDTTTATECVCTTPDLTCEICDTCTTPAVTPCPETTTVSECVCENTTCADTTTVTECTCPTTDTTMSIEPCPTTTPGYTTECPILECTTSTDCPTTSTPIDCPDVCTDSTTTNCPPQDCSECPATSTECSDSTTTITTTTTTDPLTTTECPVPECPLDCTTPATTTTTEQTTPVVPPEKTTPDCPICPTETTTPTNCPIECTTPAITPNTDCPSTECPDTSTACPDIQCPSTEITTITDCTTPTETTVTPTPTPGSLHFEEDIYTFRLPAVHAINVTFTAISDVNEDIVYGLTNSQGALPTALFFDTATGQLTNSNGLLANGLYQLIITATGQTSQDTASATVIISVSSIEICADSPRTAYSFIALDVDEHNSAVVLNKGMNEELENYNFCISSQYPLHDGIFFINEETGNLECNEINREDPIFADTIAQFTVTVELKQGPVQQKCDDNSLRTSFTETSVTTNNNRVLDARQCVRIDDIYNEPDKTIIAVIIGDINDNNPVFSEYEIVVGYPAQSLATLISAPQITQVEATDADIGFNAALSYYSESDRVTVHPATGIVYPTENIFSDDDDFEIIVFARDQNGTGLISDPLSIQIKFLDQSHISILTLTNVLLEDMHVKLNQIQTSTGVSVKPLTASVLPTIEVSTMQRASLTNYLRIVGYALDRNRELVISSDLQGLLQNVEGLEIQPLPDSPVTNDDDDDHSNTGWIVAVSVLGALLVLVIIGFIAVYFLLFRKRKSYSKMAEEGPTATTNPQFQKKSKLEYRGSKSGVDISERRSTGYIFGQSVSTENGETETDDMKERRKSVSFNTNVEQIDIEGDAENESAPGSSKQQPDTKLTLKNDSQVKTNDKEIEVQKL